MEKLRKKTERKVYDIYFAVSSTSMEMLPAKGSILLSKYGREITRRDREKCVKLGSIIRLPESKEPIHVIVNGFEIDNESGISEPVGLEGVRLGVEMNILLMDSSIIRNIEKSIAFAGYSCRGKIFSGIANSHSLVPEKDRNDGVIFINQYEDIIELSVFFQGKALSARVIPVRDLSSKADNLNVSEENLSGLIDFIKEMEGWGLAKKIIVASESGISDETLEYLEKSVDKPVRSAPYIIKPFEELSGEDRMGYAGCIGVLELLAAERKAEIPSDNPVRCAYKKVISFLDRYF
jgi:hypothetical protein